MNKFLYTVLLSCFLLLIVQANYAQTTWNGTSWSAGVPTNGVDAVITGDYNTSTHGTFECDELSINTASGDVTFTIASGDDIAIDRYSTIGGNNAIVNGDGVLIYQTNSFIEPIDILCDLRFTSFSSITLNASVLNLVRCDSLIIDSNGGFNIDPGVTLACVALDNNVSVINNGIISIYNDGTRDTLFNYSSPGSISGSGTIIFEDLAATPIAINTDNNIQVNNTLVLKHTLTCGDYIAASNSTTILDDGVTGHILDIDGDLTVNSGATFAGAASTVLGQIKFTGGITQNIFTNSLEFAGRIGVESGTTLQTNGNLVLLEDGILLHGTNTPGGGGSVSGNVEIRRNSTAVDGYSYMGPPVSNATASQLSSFVFSYNETVDYEESDPITNLTGGGINRYIVVGQSTVLTPGVGYAPWRTGSVVFDGPVNDGDITVNNITWTDGNTDTNLDINKGWNLVSNPYPGSLDAAAFLAAHGDLDASITLWNEPGGSASSRATNAGYTQWSSGGGAVGGGFNGQIASGQAFFIKRSGTGSSSVTFTNAMRLSTAGSNSDFLRVKENPLLKLMIANDSIFSDANLFAQEGATISKDRFDVYKLRNSFNLNIYSLVDGSEQIAIQSLPAFEDGTVVPFYYDAVGSGTYTFTVPQLENIPASIEVWWSDEQREVLMEEGMTFDMVITKTGKGLKLGDVIFREKVVAGQPLTTPDPKVFITTQNLTIQNIQPSRVLIYDASGKMQHDFVFQIGNRKNDVKIPVNLQNGKLYIIRVVHQEGSLVKKVIIG